MGKPLSSALADKDFLAAPAADQKAYLASIDKDFAKASSADQDAYLKHILPAPTTNVGGTSMNLRTGEGGMEGAAAQAKQSSQKPLTEAKTAQSAPKTPNYLAGYGGSPLQRFETPEQAEGNAKTVMTAMGGAMGGEAFPAVGGLAGVGLRALGTGLGAAGGTVAGQAGTGVSPVSLTSLKETGTNALGYGLGDAALGTLGLVGEGAGNAIKALKYTPHGELTPEAEQALEHPVKAVLKGSIRTAFPPDEAAVEAGERAAKYEQEGKENVDIMKRTRQQAAIDRADAARVAREARQQGAEQESNLRRVDRGEPQRPGTKPVIITPDQPLPPARTTLQSYPREVLAQRAARGDLSAIRELQRSPGKVDVSAIPNLRYVGVRPLR